MARDALIRSSPSFISHQKNDRKQKKKSKASVNFINVSATHDDFPSIVSFKSACVIYMTKLVYINSAGNLIDLLERAMEEDEILRISLGLAFLLNWFPPVFSSQARFCASAPHPTQRAPVFCVLLLRARLGASTEKIKREHTKLTPIARVPNGGSQRERRVVVFVQRVVERAQGICRSGIPG